MSAILTQPASVQDLLSTPEKAELIGGRIVRFMVTGRRPNRIAGKIFRSLDDYAERVGKGEAYTDNMGFVVGMLKSGRQSFSPDASYYSGAFSSDPMRFIEGPPTFAVEVRSENDYGDSAEKEMAAKRADYFEASTRAVWDVDPEAGCVRLYLPAQPNTPTVFTLNEKAHAAEVLPGWSVDVAWIFA